MSHSEFPDSPLPVEIEQPVVTDSSQEPQPLPERSPKPPQKRRWPLILGIILLIGGIGFGWRWWQTSSASNPPAGGAAAGQPMAIPVKLATVQPETVQESSEFIGSLEAPRSVIIKPQVEGRITNIFIQEGNRVQQGQVIISLESDSVQAQLSQAKAALAQAQARLAELVAGTRQEEVAQARAQLAQAQARFRDAQSGSQPEEIAQAEAQIQSAKSDVELAQSRAKRYAQLRKEGAVSQDTLEGYVKEQQSAEAALVVAQKRLDQVRKSRNSSINELAGALEQQRQNLRQLENGSRPEEIAQARSQVTQAAAQVQAAQVQLKYTKVLAPFTGIVGDIPTKVGDFVERADQLTTLTRNDSLELNISVPLEEAKKLRLGLPVQMLNAQGEPAARGKISFISPDASSDSQTILVKANFGNSRSQLVNRQSVQTKVIWNQRPGILIPVTAVSRLGGETFVFVAEAPTEKKAEAPAEKKAEAPAEKNAGAPSLVAQQKPVKLGAIEGNNYQVIEGLKAGDKIVVSGILNLTNGAPITPAPQEVGSRKP
ncbi:efflux RND transporter periplasmic adaptor subunit [Nostoc sp. UCD121]|uniref:efflux RND transporter periplasmic adaptor subunit n=1 Tax=unclassified Nostoc TaxID=2593658 RepID=UPI001627BC3C|nr:MULTISPECIES: efflux RND transporter periplasmic adaptor subunit [unclassified Nostoc]MBC1222171.1 efflux RND transporter periplasmic adaptor subunit [Nostoc sp. UCD120]MBC1275599.1 efflux RND transporter periplasmic adaptor subunit [Nostoc sp. UCD121]MBC1295424.1 efflux RND transporter periplasmic adaptor subunit [Nostoc sp. UCD122]